MTRLTDNEVAFAGVLRQIADSVAFRPRYYIESFLDRRISARLRRCDVDDPEAYERHVREDPEEREALTVALTITVTAFFRPPEMWDVFRDVLRKRTDENRRVRGMTESVPPARRGRDAPIDKRRRVFRRQ